jgi:iron-sulfur cluster assembly protein
MITITEPAAEHIKKHIAKRGKGLGLRIGIRTTGCSGLAYVIEYADSIDENADSIFEGYGVKVIIDKKSIVHLNGTEIDFEKQGLQQGLKFNNPKEKDKCGCGESFRV